ncbi:LANO_0A05006g1_1 [Lachancea nothofagi CBS 11611]|uniref:LANO_0A05006g1_1 n=1 Tax=Lachancea nothofagi CBS 11611 TaxID=1266666 RepID=A0A1G4IQU7_9SACH|nr:LANO_0A05006g1_1 [Lachancea nothofagi CBS 11611]
MIVPRGIRHTKRLYSSTISQDFLKNVLERVKETAAKKPISNSPKPRTRTNKRSGDDYEARGSFRNGSRRAGNSHGPVTNDPTTSRRPNINANVMNRQPQFKRRGGNGTSPGETGSASTLMDALDSVQSSGNRSQQPRQNVRKSRGLRTAQRSVPGLTQKPSSSEGIIAQAKRSAVSHQYVPEEPTPLALLKYAPKLAHSSFSKMSAYGLSALQKSDYPLNRQINIGVASFPSEQPLNVSLSPESTFFGQYAPASSLIWRKERLFTNFNVCPNSELFETTVEGKYMSLPFTSENDFNSLAKSNNKKTELVQNSNIVRLSLGRSNMDPAGKNLVFEVCSGLKPIADLKA